jgi:hypothetical protein
MTSHHQPVADLDLREVLHFLSGDNVGRLAVGSFQREVRVPFSIATTCAVTLIARTIAAFPGSLATAVPPVTSGF